MGFEVVKKWTHAAGLKREVISQYIKQMQKELKHNQQLLNDKDWASSGSKFHNDCRATLIEEQSQIRKQTKALSPKN